jgi:hypothetical protein
MGELFATARRKSPAKGRSGHAAGTTEGPRVVIVIRLDSNTRADLGFLVGAGEGNRTLMTSLEGWGSAIELRPRAFRPARNHPAASNVNTRSVPASRAYWPTALVPPVGPCARRNVLMGERAPYGKGGPTSASGLVGEKLAGRVGYGRLSGMWRSLVSAPALGAGGRRFESGHPDCSEACQR